MSDSIVQAKGLHKSFTYQKRSKGIRSWLKADYATIEAVKKIDLTINSGETVAFVGPNGAGKSTTIKMLSGILAPTGGHIRVCGLDPLKQRRALSYKIGCVFGQRSQLLPNLPLRDSLELFGRMYDLTDDTIAQRIDELSDIFALHSTIGEIAASLMHKPTVVFLDEPTIGLDVVAKRSLRETLNDLNKSEGTTIFLTSHDTGDIEALAERTIVIDRGTIIVDENTNHLRRKFLNKKYLRIDFTTTPRALSLADVEISIQENTLNATVDMTKHDINEVLHALLKLGTVEDIQIQEESLEEVILSIYESTGKKDESTQ
jgi:ABC-2 type transport system ATP-binding protein